MKTKDYSIYEREGWNSKKQKFETKFYLLIRNYGLFRLLFGKWSYDSRMYWNSKDAGIKHINKHLGRFVEDKSNY